MHYLYRKIKVDPPKLIIEVGNEFGNYYRNLIPKYARPHGTRYDTHITVIRSFEVCDLSKVIQFDGKQVIFYYEPIIQEGNYLNCWCDEACLIRRIAGLNQYRDGYNSFHISLGRS